MKFTPVGIDIARSVFQVHYVDEPTGEGVNHALRRSMSLRHFVDPYLRTRPVASPQKSWSEDRAIRARVYAQCCRGGTGHPDGTSDLGGACP